MSATPCWRRRALRHECCSASSAAPGPAGPGVVNAARLVAVVAAAWGVSATDICGPSRMRHLVAPRHVVVYLARALLEMSYPAAGALVGYQDHTSAIHACRCAAARAASDVVYAHRLGSVLAALGRSPDAFGVGPPAPRPAPQHPERPAPMGCDGRGGDAGPAGAAGPGPGRSW